MKHSVEFSEDEIKEAVGEVVKRTTGGTVVAVRLDVTPGCTSGDPRESSRATVNAVVDYQPAKSE